MSLLSEKIINTTAPLSLRDVMPYRFPLKIAADRPVRLILMAEDGHPFALNYTAGQLPDVAQAYGLTYEHDCARPGPTLNVPSYEEMFGAEEREGGVIEYMSEDVNNYIHQEMDSIIKGYEREPKGCDPVYTPVVLWMLSRIRRDRSYTYSPKGEAPELDRDQLARAAKALASTFGPTYGHSPLRTEPPAELTRSHIEEARDMLRFSECVLELLTYSEDLPTAHNHQAAELVWALVQRANMMLRTSGDEA